MPSGGAHGSDRPRFDWRVRSAGAARDAGRDEEAVGLYRRVIQNSGGYFPPANLELSYSLDSLRRNDEAVAALLPLTRRDGARYPIAFYHLGRNSEHLGRLGLAGDAYMRAATLYGDTTPQFWLDVSRVREHEGKTAEALQLNATSTGLEERRRPSRSAGGGMIVGVARQLVAAAYALEEAVRV